MWAGAPRENKDSSLRRRKRSSAEHGYEVPAAQNARGRYSVCQNRWNQKRVQFSTFELSQLEMVGNAVA